MAVRACGRAARVSYLRGMNVVAGSEVSIGQLLNGAVGLTLLGAFLACLLSGAVHAVLQASGALQTRKGAERKFSRWLAVFSVGLCLAGGGLAGLAVGAGRTVLALAKDKDIGPKTFQGELEKAARGAGMTNMTSLDVKQVRKLLAEAEAATVPLPEHLERFRPQIEEARTKLLPVVKGLLAAHESEGRLAMDEVVVSLWPKVFDELAAWERRFRRAVITSSLLCVVAIEAVLALGCLTMRLTREPQVAAPKPPKL